MRNTLSRSESRPAAVEPLESRTLLSAALDPGFGNSGQLAGYGPVIDVQTDGKIIADHGSTLARLNPDGTVDHTFNPATYKPPGAAPAQSTGKKIVIARNSFEITSIARYNANGTLDTTFGTNGKVMTSALLQKPTRGDYSGEFGNGQPTLSQYGSFTPFAIALQGDQIIVAGEVYASQNSATYGAPAFQRLTANGKVDTSFGMEAAEPGTSEFFEKVTTGVFVGRDNRIYIEARQENNADILGFDPQGHLFNDVDAQPNGYIANAVVGPDGKINVLTEFEPDVDFGNSSDKPQYPYFKRFDPDLSLDTTVNGSGSYPVLLNHTAGEPDDGPGVLATGLRVGADGEAVVSVSDQTGDGPVTTDLFKFLAYRNTAGADVEGFAYNDANSNGKRDTGEAPLRYWQVYADTNHDGVFEYGEPTTYTDYNGYYKLKGLTPGSQRIYEVRQNGWRRTQPSGDWPLGYYALTVAGGHLYSNNNFGNTTLALVSGTVYSDANQNGKRDSTDHAASGWVVYVDSNNNGKLDSTEKRVTTGAAGTYSFTLTAGTYHIRAVPQTGRRFTNPTTGLYTVSLVSGDLKANENFGVH
ncbi:MAG TPA: SdrD B-like domain-containing protein [Humisphaera sp.]|jgi:uncharacterized delta-60 repeat protein|nr:SdrD B-like domain-containing protein [Humisphaera sp.]